MLKFYSIDSFIYYALSIRSNWQIVSVQRTFPNKIYSKASLKKELQLSIIIINRDKTIIYYSYFSPFWFIFKMYKLCEIIALINSLGTPTNHQSREWINYTQVESFYWIGSSQVILGWFNNTWILRLLGILDWIFCRFRDNLLLFSDKENVYDTNHKIEQLK